MEKAVGMFPLVTNIYEQLLIGIALGGTTIPIKELFVSGGTSQVFSCLRMLQGLQGSGCGGLKAP